MKTGFIVLLCLATLAAQESKRAPSTPSGGSESKIVVEVPRVPLLFTVTDKKGRFVTDLDRKEFRILDNNKPQTIMAFNRESDLPLRIGILMDTSNSVRDRFRFEQEAAIEFIKSVLREQNDKAFLVSYDTSAELVVDFTHELER